MKKLILLSLILFAKISFAQIPLTQLNPSTVNGSIVRTNSTGKCGYLAPRHTGYILTDSSGYPVWKSSSTFDSTFVYEQLAKRVKYSDSSTLYATRYYTQANFYKASNPSGYISSVDSSTKFASKTFVNRLKPTLTSGTGIAITGTSPNFTITNSSPSSGGTVTSIATGYGLNGGTISTTGTLRADTSSSNGLSTKYYTTHRGYLTGNQTITLSGAVTGSGTTAITTTLANGVVGIANHSATGTPSSTTFLRGDNTWATVSTGMTNPMTTQGDMIYGGSSGTPTRLALGTTNYFLQAGSTAPQYFNLFGTANTFTTTQTLTAGSTSSGLIVNGNSLGSTTYPDVSIGGSSNRAMIKLGGGSSSQGGYMYYLDNTVGSAGINFKLTDATSSSGQGFSFYPVNINTTPFGIYPKYPGAPIYNATQMEFPAYHDVRIVQRSVNSSSRYLRFYTDNYNGGSPIDVERLAIQGASGTYANAYFNNVNLGINTTAPNSTFQINGSVALSPVQKNSNYTLTTTDNIVIVTATGTTQTLPTAVGITGRIYIIKLTASGSCTIATTSSQTIDGSTTYSLSAQNKYVQMVSDGSNYQIIANN